MKFILRTALTARVLGIVASLGLSQGHATPPAMPRIQPPFAQPEGAELDGLLQLVADKKMTPAQLMTQIERSIIFINNNMKRLPAGDKKKTVAFANAMKQAANAVVQLKNAVRKKDTKALPKRINAASVAIGKLNSTFGASRVKNDRSSRASPPSTAPTRSTFNR